MVPIYRGILLSHRQNGTVPFAVEWTDLEIIILNDVRQRKANPI